MGALDFLLFYSFGLLEKGKYTGTPGGLGEVQSNLAGQIRRVIYKAKLQMLLPEKSSDQNSLL